MDITQRRMTKIAREAAKFTTRTLRADGAANLESKGYLIRARNPKDGRSQLLYATEKAERLKNSKTQVETLFYEWLLEPLGKKERREFVRVLELLYQRSKAESRAGFPNVAERIKGEDRNEE